MISYYDAIVLGLGAVGSQALRGLARQGAGGRFLGVERFKLGHSRGSSHGMTRIYRTAYFEHPGYVKWCQESVRIFQEMEQEHRLALLQRCGSLVLEAASSTMNPNSPDANSLPPICKASYDAAQQHGIPVEHLTASSLRERFPQYLGTPNMVGVLEPGGGFVRCEQVLHAAQSEAKAATNVDIMEETTILRFNNLPDGSVEVIFKRDGHSDDEAVEEERVVTTKRLLVSLGGWTGQLLPSWKPHLRPIRQLQSFLQVDQDLAQLLYSYEKMPCWVMLHPDYHLPQYGVPCDRDQPGCERWLKVAIHGRDDYLVDPSQNPQEITTAEFQEAYKASSLVFDCNTLCSSAIASSSSSSSSLKEEEDDDDTTTTHDDKAVFAKIMPCFYTMTKDADFMIGVPRGYRNVFAVAGLSGHGFKMAPALGQMMVDYALDQDLSRWNMEFCSPSRFGV